MQILEDMLKIRNTVLLGLFVLISCCNEKPVEILHCGCDGVMDNEVTEMEGMLIYLPSNEAWYIDIVNQNGELFTFFVCDTEDIDDQYRIDSLEVVFSGRYNRSCTGRSINSALLDITSLK